MNVLVTGGAGFVGSALVYLLRRERPTWRIVTYDLLTYAGSLENLAALQGDEGHAFVRGDICDRSWLDAVIRGERIEAIVNAAAESHVDRSLLDPTDFVRTNVLGVQTILDVARARGGEGAPRLHR